MLGTERDTDDILPHLTIAAIGATGAVRPNERRKQHPPLPGPLDHRHRPTSTYLIWVASNHSSKGLGRPQEHTCPGDQVVYIKTIQAPTVLGARKPTLIPLAISPSDFLTSPSCTSFDMAALLKQALVVAFLAGAVTSSPLHIGIPINDADAADAGPGKVSLKQGTPHHRVPR